MPRKIGVAERRHLDPAVDRAHATRPARGRRCAPARTSRARARGSCRRATRPAARSRRAAPAGRRRCRGSPRSRRRVEPPREEAGADRVAPELVEQQAARGHARQLDPRERRQVGRHAAAEVVVDEGELGRQHGARVELDLLLEHEPLEHDARRRCRGRRSPARAGRPRSSGSARPGASRRRRERAARAGRRSATRPSPGRRPRARCRDSGRAPRGRRRRPRPCPGRSPPG